MKKIALIAVSEKGAALATILKSAVPLEIDGTVGVFTLEKYARAGQTPFTSTARLAQSLWNEYEGLIFLCASGIAVRAIAPLVHSKFTDPAVVVTGDAGAFAVSLLSGHEGGANALAGSVASALNECARRNEWTGCVPVITTASECSPAVLPRNLFVGVGCTRGMPEERIVDFVDKTFAEHHLSPRRIRALATIDLKKDEAGLIAAADALEAPLLFFSAGELNAAAGAFSTSEYVREITGSDNVCERAATCAGGTGALIIRKTVAAGMTLAVFERREK